MIIDLSKRLDKTDEGAERLSRSSQIPAARIREIMGGAEPSLNELRRIAAAEGVPLTELATPPQPGDAVPLLFRQTMGELGQSQMSTVNRLATQMERSLRLLPSGDTPSWVRRFEGRHENYIDAERNAAVFRNLFLDGDSASPLLSLPSVVASRLDVLLLIPHGCPIDGASASIRGIPFIFVAPRFPPRMLFTLAHEIGHLVARHRPDDSFAVFDTNNSTGGVSRRRNPRELFADAFASCLLLPREGVGIALKAIRAHYKIQQDQIGDLEILFLSRVFGVSFQAAARRCEDLALLPRGGARSLYDELCKRHGSPEKRADEQGLPPRPEIVFPHVPVRLLNAAVEKIRRGEISIGKAASDLNVSIWSLIDANRGNNLAPLT